MCNFLANLVLAGRYPDDEETLGKIVEDISYNNALKYFQR
jgi:glucuronate isomerase